MKMTKEANGRKEPPAPAATSRRQARRFGVAWPVVVRGKGFQEFALLKNLSATGACLVLTRALAPDSAVEMDVRTPLSRRQWLRYFGKVVYAGEATGPQLLGVRFDSVRPAFVPTAAVVCFRQRGVASCIVH